jgi:predicted nucleotidyltransferase
MKFGSHLYGTATEESDTDFKGIYLPEINDLVLQRVSKSINNITKKDSSQKNSKDDVDEEIYSLHQFIELSIKGETVSLDMLHAPEDWEEAASYDWKFIKKYKHLFYTKSLRSYMGYVKTQAAKYGIKGSRLAAAEKMINWLKTKDERSKICDYWEEIPIDEHIEKIVIEDARQQDNRAISICSRKLMADTRIWYAIECVQKFYESYGERAKMAKENKGLDFKAISHAFRAGLQLREIYKTGNLKYPLKDAEFLRDIKQGKFHYQDELSPKLEEIVKEVETLSQASNYPDKVDRKFWDEWIIELYTKRYICHL